MCKNIAPYIMRKIIDIPLSILFILYFIVLMLVFHVIEAVCFNLWGRNALQKAVNVFNFFIVKGWYLTGSTATFTQTQHLPTDRPMIFIANHQNMFDIPGIIWFLRKHTPLFVSKKELAKGVPGISYNLRHGGAALIDRKDGKQAVVEIAKLGTFIKENNFSAAIFPEGTRSRTGELKPFAVGGVATLLKRADNALVVPIAIVNTGKFNSKGFLIRAFTPMSWTVLPAIEPKGLTPEEVVQKAEAAIRQQLGQSH